MLYFKTISPQETFSKYVPVIAWIEVPDMDPKQCYHVKSGLMGCSYWYKEQSVKTMPLMFVKDLAKHTC